MQPSMIMRPANIDLAKAAASRRVKVSEQTIGIKSLCRGSVWGSGGGGGGGGGGGERESASCRLPRAALLRPPARGRSALWASQTGLSCSAGKLKLGACFLSVAWRASSCLQGLQAGRLIARKRPMRLRLRLTRIEGQSSCIKPRSFQGSAGRPELWAGRLPTDGCEWSARASPGESERVGLGRKLEPKLRLKCPSLRAQSR